MLFVLISYLRSQLVDEDMLQGNRRRTVVLGSLLTLAASFTVSAVVGAEDNNSGRSGYWHRSAQGAPSLKASQRAVEKNPNDAIANNDLGWAYRQNGDNAQAEKYLRTAIKLNGKLGQAHSNLSVVLFDQNKFDEALAEGEQAVAADPENPVFHVVLGNAYGKKGDSKNAIAQYRTAVKLKPDYENALYHLGRTLADSGDKLEAKVVLSQALGLDAKDDRVVALLDKLAD